MPTQSVSIFGADPVQEARVRSFLSTVGTKKLPAAVVIVPPSNFRAVAKAMGGEDSNWAFTAANRVYLNGAAFDQQHPNKHYSGQYFPEFLLGHELSHLNDTSTSLASQEQLEQLELAHHEPNSFDVMSKNLLNKWQKNNGPAYSQAQQNAYGQVGKLQTVQPQITTELQDSQPPAIVLDKQSQALKSQYEGHAARMARPTYYKNRGRQYGI